MREQNSFLSHEKYKQILVFQVSLQCCILKNPGQIWPDCLKLSR